MAFHDVCRTARLGLTNRAVVEVLLVVSCASALWSLPRTPRVVLAAGSFFAYASIMCCYPWRGRNSGERASPSLLLLLAVSIASLLTLAAIAGSAFAPLVPVCLSAAVGATFLAAYLARHSLVGTAPRVLSGVLLHAWWTASFMVPYLLCFVASSVEREAQLLGLGIASFVWLSCWMRGASKVALSFYSAGVGLLGWGGHSSPHREWPILVGSAVVLLAGCGAHASRRR